LGSFGFVRPLSLTHQYINTSDQFALKHKIAADSRMKERNDGKLVNMGANGENPSY
jgi:hypothetical protein